MEWLQEKLNAWSLGAGSLAGAALTLVLGWMKLKLSEKTLDANVEQSLTTEQRKMLEAAWERVESLSRMITEQQHVMDEQRKFYEAKLNDAREGYQRHVKDLNQHIRHLEGRVAKLSHRLNQHEERIDESRRPSE